MNKTVVIGASETIGIIDSGVGGLSILNALLTISCVSHVIYVADAAHLPYGQKSTEYLIDRATRITSYLQQQGVSTIFVACHTLSATALPFLKKLFPAITYIDMVPGTTTKALQATRNKQIGIMATTATISSAMHKNLLKVGDPTITTFEQACPLFVGLIEQDTPKHELQAAIKLYLQPLLDSQVDTIILGCTHYPFIHDFLQKEAPHVTFISAANSFPELVFEKNPANNVPKTTVHFVTTASLDYMEQAVIRYFAHTHSCTTTYEVKSDL